MKVVIFSPRELFHVFIPLSRCSIKRWCIRPSFVSSPCLHHVQRRMTLSEFFRSPIMREPYPPGFKLWSSRQDPFQRLLGSCHLLEVSLCNQVNIRRLSLTLTTCLNQSSRPFDLSRTGLLCVEKPWFDLASAGEPMENYLPFFICRAGNIGHAGGCQRQLLWPNALLQPQ